MDDRAKALLRVQTTGFAIDEAALFLDTHPQDKQALDFYHKTIEEYNRAVENYVSNFGPINVNQVRSHDTWSWTRGCMPWEAECNVEI